MSEALHAGVLCAAFWTAVLRYRGREPWRFVAGLGLGAVFAHLGWALLHWSAVAGRPGALLDPALGYSVLFFPLGPLLLAPGPATWRALPLALAVARAGCLVAGCCGGVPAPWGAHPTPLYEIVLLVALHVAVQRAPEAGACAIFLLGFGLERLAVVPLRAAPPLGEPVPAPEILAACWALAGVFALPALRRALPATLGLLALLGCGVRMVAPPDDRPDYLRYVAFRMPGNEHALLRWPRRQFPLAIFLPPAPAEVFLNPAEIRAAARAGILAWTGAAGEGLPSFRFVETAGEADVPVNWAGDAPTRSIAHCFYDIHYYQRRFGVAQILVTGRYRGAFATPEQVRITVMHEMGHALGLGGHSPNPGDLMYGFVEVGVPHAGAEAASRGLEPAPGEAYDLSERDRATLRRLYAKPNGARMGGAKRAY